MQCVFREDGSELVQFQPVEFKLKYMNAETYTWFTPEIAPDCKTEEMDQSGTKLFYQERS